jgi:hypothetical protein
MIVELADDISIGELNELYEQNKYFIKDMRVV